MDNERTSSRCNITTNKSSMIIYAFLYIAGLIVILIGCIWYYMYIRDIDLSNILDYNQNYQYFLLCFIIGISLFVFATIVWALDRKCEISKSK